MAPTIRKPGLALTALHLLTLLSAINSSGSSTALARPSSQSSSQVIEIVEAEEKVAHLSRQVEHWAQYNSTNRQQAADDRAAQVQVQERDRQGRIRHTHNLSAQHGHFERRRKAREPKTNDAHKKDSMKASGKASAKPKQKRPAHTNAQGGKSFSLIDDITGDSSKTSDKNKAGDGGLLGSITGTLSGILDGSILDGLDGDTPSSNSHVPSVTNLGTGIRFLFQNDLNWPTQLDPLTRQASYLLLTAEDFTLRQAEQACARLSEDLPSGSDAAADSGLARQLVHLQYEGFYTRGQDFWVDGGRLRFSQNGELEFDPLDEGHDGSGLQLPVLCTQSAPYSTQYSTDDSKEWHVAGQRGGLQLRG